MSALQRGFGMKGLLGTIGMLAGSWAGWFLGAPAGFFVAFLVSGVGAGVGLYYGRKLAARYE